MNPSRTVKNLTAKAVDASCENAGDWVNSPKSPSTGWRKEGMTLLDATMKTVETALRLTSPLVALAGRDNGVRVWSSEWLGLVCSSRPLLTISLGSRTTAGIDPGALELFGVSLPPAALLVPSWLPALLAGAGKEVLAEAGLSIALGTAAGAPLVSGCALHFECRNGTVAIYPGTVLISAEVAAIHRPEGTLGPENWPDLARLQPLRGVSPRA
jgi:flavin reductase (DIM6/NTAB) family NADH-FMN oxidoreductase RutF